MSDDNNTAPLSQEDLRAIQETLYLLSIPGMEESIKEGIKTPFSEMASILEW